MTRALLAIPIAVVFLFTGHAAGCSSDDDESTTQPTETPAPTSTTPSESKESTSITSTTTPPVIADPTLVWGFDDAEPDPGWARPDLGAVYVDDSYGTTIRRVSDATGTRFNRNTYSRRQAENIDGSAFFTYHGEAAYNVYDRETLELIRQLDMHPDAEPQWHPTDPDRIRHIAGPNSSVGDLKLFEVEVSTAETTVIADLTDRIRAELPTASYLYDRAEGSPSADGNRYAWIVYDDAERPLGIVSYDLAEDRILGLRTDFVDDPAELDWVSMSPSGEFVLAGYWDGTYRQTFELDAPTRLTLTGEHSDLAINSAGNDAYVYIDFSAGPNGGWLVSIDLETLEATRIFDVYDDANTSMHVSGKAYAKPGWVAVSTYNCKVPGAWSCEKVMAVELQPDGRVLQLAHTHNCGESYWTETHAVVNRGFSRVYFNTDSGSCGIDAEVMEITVPTFD